MSLQLNDVEKYKVFPQEGDAPIIEQMHLLIAECRRPLSVQGLLRIRLEVLTASEPDKSYKSFYWDSYFDTADAIAYHPDGRVKIVLDSEDLRQVIPKSRLSLGALVLPDGRYEQLQGQEFTREQLSEYTGNDLTKRQAKSNPIWQALTREQAVLDQYVDEVFSQAKERFDYNENMNLHVSNPQKQPTLRNWVVDWLKNSSDAFGNRRLDAPNSHLVGVAP